MTRLSGIVDVVLSTEAVKSQRIFWPNWIAFSGVALIGLSLQLAHAWLPVAILVWAFGTALLVRFVIIRSAKRKSSPTRLS